MEIFELRYFVAVAAQENIHRASERLNVSPASLSKAIARLETELGLSLFTREGRNIRLTEQGLLLRRRASEILHMEESARAEIGAHRSVPQAVIVGPEVLLSKFGFELSQKIQERYPGARCEFVSADEARALEKVEFGEAHVAFVTDAGNRPLHAKTVNQTSFVTCVGPGHPLFGVARKKKPIPIEKVLEHGFVNPSHTFLGQVGPKQSTDGWRDDKFERKISYRTSSLKLLEAFVTSGQALAYLPDYYAEKLKLAVLQVTGCPYACAQTIRMVVRNPAEVSWIRQLY